MGSQPLRTELSERTSPRPVLDRAHAKPTDRGADGVKAVSRRRRGRASRQPVGRPVTGLLQHSCSEWDGMANHIALIWVSEKQKYICQGGLTEGSKNRAG